MKTLLKSITVSLLVGAMVGSAIADAPRGHYPQGQHRIHQGRGHDSGWVAPLLFLGLAGAVIGAAASQPSAPPPAYPQPDVTYVRSTRAYVSTEYTAPVIVTQTPPQPVNAWYFCKSVGQYYPYTQYCPEGWQLVSPMPQ